MSSSKWPWLLFLLTLPIYFFNGLFASQNVRPQIFSGQARSLLNQSKVKPVITRERMLLMASFSVKCPNNAIFRGVFGMGTRFYFYFSAILLNELLRTSYQLWKKWLGMGTNIVCIFTSQSIFINPTFPFEKKLKNSYKMYNHVHRRFGIILNHIKTRNLSQNSVKLEVCYYRIQTEKLLKSRQMFVINTFNVVT